MNCNNKTKKMMKGGMAKSDMMDEKMMGKKKKYAKGGKVRGAGMCKKGVRPAKMM